MTTILLIAAFLLATAGFAALALSQAPHYRQLARALGYSNTKLSRTRQWLLRALGYLLLLASLVLLNLGYALALGLVYWFALLTLAAALVALALAYGR